MKKIFTAFIGAFLAALMTFSASAVILENIGTGTIEYGNEFTLGDVNGDGFVNARDAHALKSYVTGSEEDVCVDAADFNADGAASARDALYLKACLAGTSQLSDFENGKTIYSLTIAGNPIEDYDVVYTPDFVKDADIQTLTGHVLRSYLRRATNSRKTFEDYIGTGEAPHHIYIKRLDPFAPAEERMNLDIEDYIYEVKDGDLYIYGTLRGTLYAVYEILEDWFGFSFYTHSRTHLFKSRRVDIPEGTYVYHKATHVKYRGCNLFADSGNQFSYYFANRFNCSNISANNGAGAGYLTGCLFDNAHSFGSTYRLGTGYDVLVEQGADMDAVLKNIWNIYPHGVQKDNSKWQPCASAFGEGSEYQTMMKGLRLIFTCYQNMGYNVQEMIDLGVLRQSFSMCDNGYACTCRACKGKIGGTVVKRANLDMVEGYTGAYVWDAGAKTLSFEKEFGSGLYVDFVNHAISDLSDEYPGVTLWTILYDHNIPTTVRPQNGLGIMYCGHGCINHKLGIESCGDDVTVLGANNNDDVVAMKWWAEKVHEAGGQIWFWSYATNYSYSFSPTPDIYELYYNFHFLCEECDYDGFFMEGCGYDNNFETLKAYITSKLCWNPSATWDDFVGYMTEFLELYYGSSEELLRYIDMQQTAGDLNPCCITNHDRPWDFYNWQYLDAHYEEMRALLETAFAKAKTDEQRHRVELLIYSCDFMGISSAWERLYLNGTADSKKTVEERYSALFNYFDKNLANNENEYQSDPYPFPDELDLTVCPMILFYDTGAWRTSCIPPFAR